MLVARKPGTDRQSVCITQEWMEPDTQQLLLFLWHSKMGSLIHAAVDSFGWQHVKRVENPRTGREREKELS